MAGTFDRLAVIAVAIVFAGFLQPFLPTPLTDVASLSLFNDPLIQVAVIANVAYLVLASVVARFSSSESAWRSTPSIDSAEPREPPSTVESTWEGVRFGVTWSVQYGHRPGVAAPYAYAASPRCPACDADVATDVEPRMLRRPKPIWRCPVCRFTTQRPRRHLGEERDAVQRAVERGTVTQSPVDER